jgi:hypothetical protein
MIPSSFYDYRNAADLASKEDTDAHKGTSWSDISSRDKGAPERLWDAVNDVGDVILSQIAILAIFKFQKVGPKGRSVTQAERNIGEALADASHGKVRTTYVNSASEAINIGKAWVGDKYKKVYRTRTDGSKYLSAYESADGHRRFRLPVKKKAADGNSTGKYDGNLEYRKDPNVSWGNKGAVKRGDKTNTHIGIKDKNE